MYDRTYSFTLISDNVHNNCVGNIAESTEFPFPHSAGWYREYRGTPDSRRVRDGTSTDSRKGCGTGSGPTPIEDRYPQKTKVSDPPFLRTELVSEMDRKEASFPIAFANSQQRWLLVCVAIPPVPNGLAVHRDAVWECITTLVAIKKVWTMRRARTTAEKS
jgi:hypothetical protein